MSLVAQEHRTTVTVHMGQSLGCMIYLGVPSMSRILGSCQRELVPMMKLSRTFGNLAPLAPSLALSPYQYHSIDQCHVIQQKQTGVHMHEDVDSICNYIYTSIQVHITLAIRYIYIYTHTSTFTSLCACLHLSVYQYVRLPMSTLTSWKYAHDPTYHDGRTAQKRPLDDVHFVTGFTMVIRVMTYQKKRAICHNYTPVITSTLPSGKLTWKQKKITSLNR